MASQPHTKKNAFNIMLNSGVSARCWKDFIADPKMLLQVISGSFEVPSDLLTVASWLLNEQCAVVECENSAGIREINVTWRKTPVDNDIKMADMIFVSPSSSFFTSNPKNIPSGLKMHMVTKIIASFFMDCWDNGTQDLNVAKETTSDNRHAWREMPMNMDIASAISFCNPKVTPKNRK